MADFHWIHSSVLQLHMDIFYSFRFFSNEFAKQSSQFCFQRRQTRGGNSHDVRVVCMLLEVCSKHTALQHLGLCLSGRDKHFAKMILCPFLFLTCMHNAASAASTVSCALGKEQDRHSKPTPLPRPILIPPPPCPDISHPRLVCKPAQTGAKLPSLCTSPHQELAQGNCAGSGPH